MNKITEDELKNDLIRVKNLLGRTPSYEDMRQYGKYGNRTYQRRLGPTWDDVKRTIGWVPNHETFDIDDVSDTDGGWLSGLIDGEGCFTMQAPGMKSNNGKSKSFAPVFTISIRKDDLPILNEFQRIVKNKNTVHIDNRLSEHRKGRVNAKPAYKISIRDLPTLLFLLIPIIEKYPLRGKKQFELPLFKLALTILYNKRYSGALNLAYTDTERDALKRIYHALHEMKSYQADYNAIISKYNLSDLLIDCSILSTGTRPKKS